MKKEIEKLLDKSQRSLRIAKRLCEDGDYDVSVSRAYYAIFYISEALLLSKDKIYSKHSAVMSAIYNVFVREGYLSRQFHSVLHAAFDMRQRGDYFSDTDVKKEDAADLIDKVEAQISEGIKLLKV